jgi:thiamine-monophosphate kinase
VASGEFDFIARRLRPLAAGAPGALDLLDDAALLDPPPGAELVLTKDAMVAGVHFLSDDPPARVAQKLLRVNLSDLAAMGAAPLGYLLALARSKAIADDWLAAFCAGLAADNAAFLNHR